MKRGFLKGMLPILLASAAVSGALDEGFKLDPKDINTTPKDLPLPKGCKKYSYSGFECVASSEKAALKKYRKWKDKK